MRIFTRFLSVFLIAAVVFAACSSDDSSTDETVPPSTAAPSPPPPSSSTTSTQAPIATTTSTGALPTTTTDDPAETTVLPETTVTEAPTTTTTTIPDPLPANQVNVKVFNGSGVSGAAGHLTRSLVADDYVGLSPANAPQSYPDSIIYYVAPEYWGNALMIAQMLGLTDPESVQMLPDPAPFAYGNAHVIIIIGRDQLSASISAEIAALAPTTTTPSSTSTTRPGSTSTTTPSSTSTTRSTEDLFPTATTMPPETSTTTTIPPTTTVPSENGPPPIPSIDFGNLDDLGEPNIRVTIRDGSDEGERLRYLVRMGSELNIEVLSLVGTGTVLVEGYEETGEISRFAGAWISFTANRTGVFNVTFTPDSTGEEEIIFQIDVRR